MLELAARVDYVRRDFPTYPQSFPGWVRLETRSGDVFERELAHQRGGPENPMDVEAVAAKFRRNAALAIGEESIAALEDAILALEQHDDLARCLAPLRADAVPA